MNQIYLISASIYGWCNPNSGVDIKLNQSFETHLNFNRYFTGSLTRISAMSSWGKLGFVNIETFLEALYKDISDGI